MLHNLREIAPTFYLAAPRSWDNLLTAIQVRMEDSIPAEEMHLPVLHGGRALGRKRKLEGGEADLARTHCSVRSASGSSAAPIKDQFGLARLRGAFTGGEAMGEDTFVFYRALGIKLRQLYGQTETSAYNAIQSMDEVRLHTVGRALPGRRDSDQRRPAKFWSAPAACFRLLQAGLSHPRNAATTAGCIPATPAISNPTDISSCSAASPMWCTPPRASATFRTISRTG